MHPPVYAYPPPSWRPTIWLADPGTDVPEDIRARLIGSLFGTLVILIGGAVNNSLVSLVVAFHNPAPLVVAWCMGEITISLMRLAVVIQAQRAAAAGRPTPTDLYLVISLIWSASHGCGPLICLTNGDWVGATLTCLSTGALVAGTCFRNFAVPRLSAAMMSLTLAPCCLGVALAGAPSLAIIFLQVPFFLFSMTRAAFTLNGMLIATMRAERANGLRALHDGLTGLANRAGLTSAYERIPEDDAALLYLDLDGFKAVNDTYGHAVGDKLLQRIAERLLAEADARTVPVRIGGDEFVVLCAGRPRAALIELGERLIERVSEPYSVGDAGPTIRVGLSVGIAMASEHGGDLATLMHAADVALYRAKSLGKGRCCLAPRRASSERDRRDWNLKDSDRAIPQDPAFANPIARRRP